MASKNNTIKLKFESARNLAPAPESRSAAKINPRYDLFINGKFEKPLSKKYFDTINPANEEKISEVAEANAADVNRAVKAARTAYDSSWKKMPAKEFEVAIQKKLSVHVKTIFKAILTHEG